MKPSIFNNTSCPECGHDFGELDMEGEIICPECYTTLQVRFFEWHQRGMYIDDIETGYYIPITDNYIPLSMKKKHYQTQDHGKN